MTGPKTVNQSFECPHHFTYSCENDPDGCPAKDPGHDPKKIARLEDFICSCCGGVWKVRVGPTKMAVVRLVGWCRRCNWGLCSRDPKNYLARCNEGKKRQP